MPRKKQTKKRVTKNKGAKGKPRKPQKRRAVVRRKRDDVKKTNKRKKEKLPGKYAYVIKDKNFGELRLINSANAWWLEREKVLRLIDAFKIDSTDDEACFYAGISIDQYKYFKKKHPEFSTIKTACKELPKFKARKTLFNDLHDPRTAMWYLERKLKEEFSPRQIIDDERRKRPFEDLTNEELAEFIKKSKKFLLKK
ncbi:MAG: hypothetical protein ABIC19_00695 [Patescibacteria group bacterium]|nr:hypothetical protein [Patescibacteria group bacterium]